MKKIWIFTSVISVTALIIFFSFFINDSDIQAETNFYLSDSSVTITISLVGDLMCHSTQFNYAKVDKDSFDFKPVFREVRKYFDRSDFVIGNLETVTAGREEVYSGYPFFNTPDDYIAGLKDAGFDLLVTANNHSLDQGEKGIRRTIEQISKNNIKSVGTFTSSEDRDSIRIFNINGIKIAVLSYTYSTNGIPKPKGKDYLVNLIDYNLIERDIKLARNSGGEIVLVYYHFGEEYQRLPNDYQKEVVKFTINQGADLIIGSHPHVIQPFDYFETYNANLDTGFIVYSLGNFISNQQWRYSDAGVILNIDLTKNFKNDSIFISDINYIPTWVFRGETERGKEFIILPSQKFDNSSFNFLSDKQRIQMKEALEDTKNILTKFSDRARLYELQ